MKGRDGVLDGAGELLQMEDERLERRGQGTLTYRQARARGCDSAGAGRTVSPTTHLATRPPSPSSIVPPKSPDAGEVAIECLIEGEACTLQQCLA